MTSASFSPDGMRVVTGGDARTGIYGTAKVWDTKTGAEVLILKVNKVQTRLPSHTIYSVSFSPDGSQVVTGNGDGTAKVWDAKSGAEVFTLKGHIVQVISASFSPDGERILTGSLDGTAKVWDAKSRAAIVTLKVDNAAADMFSRLMDAKSASRLMDAKSAAILTPKGFRSLPHFGNVQPGRCSRSVTASLDGTAKVWDAKSGAHGPHAQGNTGAGLVGVVQPGPPADRDHERRTRWRRSGIPRVVLGPHT